MTIDQVIALGDENKAFRVMSAGAAKVVAQAYTEARFDGMLATGGTMGTDLALDCAQALPMGVPKYIVSTVSFSPLIPPHRLAPDVQMILWAGGLYGMNSICRSSLAQAAGAVVGAANAAIEPDRSKPLIGMTSLGSSCLRYMKTLKPELENRGYEVAVFHSTGMGGMAFEKLAAEGAFVCVMDFCMQEFGNMLAGSVVSSGTDRLTNAAVSAFHRWSHPARWTCLILRLQDIPEQYADRPFHEHNRLIKSSVFNGDERRAWIRELANRLESATGPVHFFLPALGIEAWDREGGEAHDPDALADMLDEARKVMPGRVPMTELDAHINDDAFCDAVLAQFDRWIQDGVIPSS